MYPDSMNLGNHQCVLGDHHSSAGDRRYPWNGENPLQWRPSPRRGGLVTKRLPVYFNVETDRVVLGYARGEPTVLGSDALRCDRGPERLQPGEVMPDLGALLCEDGGVRIASPALATMSASGRLHRDDVTWRLCLDKSVRRRSDAAIRWLPTVHRVIPTGLSF